ncbi:MAG: hypothetical protein KKD44_28330 [Proteobacteria bacterium]|nr:hypothetical protein [Pseudomonadota bacterium]
MTPAIFNKLVKEVYQEGKRKLNDASKGYSGDDDRLSFFKRAGDLDGETPERALKGMWKKHLVSVLDIIKMTEECPEKLTIALVREKICDSMNYHPLLLALLVERIGAQDQQKDIFESAVPYSGEVTGNE